MQQSLLAQAVGKIALGGEQAGISVQASQRGRKRPESARFHRAASSSPRTGNQRLFPPDHVADLTTSKLVANRNGECECQKSSDARTVGNS